MLSSACAKRSGNRPRKTGDYRVFGEPISVVCWYAVSISRDAAGATISVWNLPMIVRQLGQTTDTQTDGTSRPRTHRLTVRADHGHTDGRSEQTTDTQTDGPSRPRTHRRTVRADHGHTDGRSRADHGHTDGRCQQTKGTADHGHTDGRSEQTTNTQRAKDGYSIGGWPFYF